jgi:hypothetical protein
MRQQVCETPGVSGCIGIANEIKRGPVRVLGTEFSWGLPTNLFTVRTDLEGLSVPWRWSCPTVRYAPGGSAQVHPADGGGLWLSRSALGERTMTDYALEVCL